jgi:iron complex transport system permease protein
VTAVPTGVDVVVVRPVRVRPLGLVVGVVALVGTVLLSLTLGAAHLPVKGAVVEVLDHLPFVHVHSGLSASQAAIVWKIRFPRIVLGVLVGAMLSMSGASYQGVFRNPLADPILLGVSAGAGVGATAAIVFDVRHLGPVDAIPVAAFVGALAGVALTYALARIGDSSRSPAVLLLAGVAVAAFLSAVQTYLQQSHVDSIREVFVWILGRLSTGGWSDVWTVLPYAVGTSAVLLACGRVLDVLSVGDDEATTLGLDVAKARLVIVITSSLAVAAAVSVSGIIGFVGVIVPHTVRMVAGTSYRVILPLSILFGGAFLVASDLIARTIMSPAELPIGVVTAFFGAPFFAVVLRNRKLVSV